MADMHRDLENVVVMVRENRIPDALRACIRYVKNRKGDADGWFVLAGIHSTRGDFDKVLQCCHRVLELQPDHAAALYNSGVALQSMQRHADAIPCYEKCLELQPGNRAAHTNLAIACHEEGFSRLRAGKPGEAARFAARALALEPGRADTHNLLGLAALAGKDPAGAEQHMLKALELDPHHFRAITNLATAYAETGRLREAESAYRKALDLNPDYFDAWNNLGLLRQKAGNPGDAITAFTQAIRCNPNSAVAHNNAGNARLANDDIDTAVEHFRTSVRIDPGFSEAWNNLGNALLMTGDHRTKYPEAEQCYRQAIRLRPDMAEAWYNLGVSLHPQARFEEALDHYTEALRLRPAYDDAIAARSRALEHIGRFDEAMAAITPLIDAGTTNINVAIAFGTLAKRFHTSDRAIQLLGHILDNRLDTRNASEAHFVMGTLLDSCRRFEQAFRHFEQANAIDVPAYHHEDTVRLYQQLVDTFTRKRNVTMPRSTNDSDLPVFIVGMPRSGTSLVEQILASHPEVHGAGELEDIGNIANRFSTELNTLMTYPECVNLADQATLDRLATGYLDTLRRLGGSARRVTDKMPHNFQALGMIGRLFPNAHVIHCVRDPADTCLSIWFQHFNAHHAYSCSLHDLGIYYREYVRLMENWKQALDLPILEVRYEDLVGDLEAVSREMIQFIGLEWNKACLQFHSADRIVVTPSYDQVRQPIYRKSVQRWKNYAPWIAPLLDALQVER